MSAQRACTIEADKRSEPRRPLIGNGRVLLDDGRQVLDCVVWNTSSRGAQLKLPCVLPLPAAFWVAIGRQGAAIPVTRAWQKGLNVGVRFVSPARSAAT